MGILPVTHPDIEQFITCKKTEGKITNFNLSVSVTDAFMQAVADGMPSLSFAFAQVGVKRPFKSVYQKCTSKKSRCSSPSSKIFFNNNYSHLENPKIGPVLKSRYDPENL
jgi:hypothetical protein